MTIIIQDTFTEASATNLTSHTGEVGASWTEHTSYTSGNCVVHPTNNQCGADAVTGCCYASGVPSVAEYDVEFDAYRENGTSQDDSGVCARVDTSADTMYVVYYKNHGVRNAYLGKLVSGSFTQLGVYTVTLPEDSDDTWTLQIRDATKKLFEGANERISSTDNAITAAGRVGVRFATAVTTDTSQGVKISRIEVDDLQSSGDYTPPQGLNQNLSGYTHTIDSGFTI